MNFPQWLRRVFAAAAPAPAPARYQYLSIHNTQNTIDNNDGLLGKAGPRSHLPPIEERGAPVAGVMRVPSLEFIGSLFQSEAAEAEAQYEARKRGITPRRPESNTDSLR